MFFYNYQLIKLTAWHSFSRGQSGWRISLSLLFLTHKNTHLHERIKMDCHCVPAHFYDVSLIYIDKPAASNRGALLKLNGTSFGGCEIFDTGQIVPSSFISAHPRHRSERLSYFADYYTAWRCIIRESATSQSGIISKLSSRCYRRSQALITEQ